MTKPTAPMVSGLPVLGNIVEFMRDKIKFIDRGYQEHGNIFGFNMAGQKMAMLLGNEHAATFFEMTNKQLSQEESMQYLMPVLGKVGILGGLDEYMKDRKVVAPLLGGRHMRGHVDAMAKESSLWIQQAEQSGEFDINHFAQDITIYVAARALLGNHFRDQLGEEFVSLFHTVANGVDQVLPYSIPLPRFRKRDEAKAKIDYLVGKLVDERRANPDKYDDFFQKIVDAELEDGSQFSRERVIAIVMLLMFAGFDTTSAHLAWGFVYLLEHPDMLERVMLEVDAVFEKTDAIALEHLREMPHLNYAMLEVERLRPAVQVMIRRAVEDVEIGGYLIPAGWDVMISPEYTQQMGEIFSQPEQFDPERFNDERCEHAQHPNALQGFGGGFHKCWGMKFAYNEMAVIIATLFHSYDFDLSHTPVKEALISQILRPDVKLRYRQRVAQPVS